jgi:hypothetical protein
MGTRWVGLRFGVIDLLAVTALIATLVALFRPASPSRCRAAPALFGVWTSDALNLAVYPDGCYSYYMWSHNPYHESGVGYKLQVRDRVQERYLYECGSLRLVIRSEWGSGRMELFREDGSIALLVKQHSRMEGATRDDKPHGVWKDVGADGRIRLLEYEDGEPVDARDPDGQQDTARLGELRRLHGLGKIVQRP